MFGIYIFAITIIVGFITFLWAILSFRRFIRKISAAGAPIVIKRTKYFFMTEEQIFEMLDNVVSYYQKKWELGERIGIEKSFVNEQMIIH